MNDKIADITAARMRRAQSKIQNALAGLSEEDAKRVVEDALRELESELKVEVKKP